MADNFLFIHLNKPSRDVAYHEAEDLYWSLLLGGAVVRPDGKR